LPCGARTFLGDEWLHVDAVARPGSVPGSLTVTGGRPSIYERRCRRPPAVYPRTRAGRPRTHTHPLPVSTGLLDLAPGGVCLAGPVARAAGGLLHRRFTLTSTPIRRQGGGGLFSVALIPRVTPGGRYPPPRPVEPGPSSTPPRDQPEAMTRSPAVLVVSCTTVSPLPPSRSEDRAGGGLFSVALIPRVTPGGRYPPPCPVEPGPSSTPRSLLLGDAVARPGSVRRAASRRHGWRPSISGCRCRHPPATYP